MAQHWILSPQWIPLLFISNNPRIVVLFLINTLWKRIQPYNGQWQPHYNFLSHQFAKHCCCNRDESLAKTHFIHSWHNSIPNPPPHNEPYGPNLVCQKPSSKQVWNWILLACSAVICWWANRLGIQQPDRIIKKCMFKFFVDCVENSIQYWTGIIWIEVLLTIHLLLNLSCSLVRLLYVLNDLSQLLRGELGWWVHTPALLRFIAMLGISQTSIPTQWICGIQSILFTRSELTLILLSVSFPPASSSATLSFSLAPFKV